jgi:hypothetical protein
MDNTPETDIEDNEEREEQKAQETMQTVTLSEDDPQITPGPQSWGGRTEGTQMVTWQRLDDSWWGCLQGATDGNWWEGEDQGPFDSRGEAEAELREQYEHPEEEIEMYPEESDPLDEVE